jgi:hypothetical protein
MLIPTVHSATAVLILMCIGNAFNYLPNSIYWTVVLDTEPKKAGTFGGVTHFIANLATIIAPTLTGSLVAIWIQCNVYRSINRSNIRNGCHDLC